MGSRLYVNKDCTETHACFVFVCLRDDVIVFFLFFVLHFATSQHPVVTKGALICIGRCFIQLMLLINIFCNNIGEMPDNITKFKKKRKTTKKKKNYFDPLHESSSGGDCRPFC